MGSTQSIDNTILGRSLIGRRFRTTNSFWFSNIGYVDSYSISLSYSPKTPTFSVTSVSYNEFRFKFVQNIFKINNDDDDVNNNSHPFSFLMFEITNVDKTWSIDEKNNIIITVKILNDIPISSIDTIYEGSYKGEWIKRNTSLDIEPCHSIYCPPCCSINNAKNDKNNSWDQTVLKTTGLSAHLNWKQFGFNITKMEKRKKISDYYDVNVPCPRIVNSNLIEL